MAPLVLALQAEPEAFDVKVCVTAQHREMLDQVLQIFVIQPDIDLNLMKAGRDCSMSLAPCCWECAGYWPSSADAVLVHGDTTTAWPLRWRVFMPAYR